MGYERGLHEVGDGIWAYLQPDGGWGWSNAGLVVDGERSLLVDTLFDLQLTAQMLGDLLFHGGHPIVWAGPVTHWIEACDRLLALDAAVVVPGHGPLGDRQAIEDQRGYLRWLIDEGTPRFEAGMDPLGAARDLAGGPYAGWGEGERLVANLTALWRDLGGSPPDDVVTLFGAMANLAAGRP